MADRAGVFDAVESIDYAMVTEKSFDWPLWIEQESRRRYCTAFVATSY